MTFIVLTQEYLSYRTYNQLTDHSFRVRLLKITYKDTAGGQDPITRLGFVIEDEKRMALRNGVELFVEEDVQDVNIDRDPTSLRTSQG